MCIRDRFSKGKGYGKACCFRLDGNRKAERYFGYFICITIDVYKRQSFEGNPGPYILYTIVRIKSILSKYEAQGGDISALKDAIMPAVNAGQKNLMLSLAKFNEMCIRDRCNTCHYQYLRRYLPYGCKRCSKLRTCLLYTSRCV